MAGKTAGKSIDCSSGSTSPADAELAADFSIATIPAQVRRRVIDAGLLYGEASAAGLKERYGRGETSHTIHVWWARRPHSAMRSLVLSSLCEDSETARNLVARVAGDSSPHVMNEAGRLLASQFSDPPRVLDMFGGGGTISLEAAALSAESFSVDANQLAVFIQKSNLVWSKKVKGDLKGLILASGTRVLNRLALATAPLFPLRDKGIVNYIWTYSVRCPNCSYVFFLSKRRWLSRKKGKQIGIQINREESGESTKIVDLKDSGNQTSAWIGRTREACCPECKRIMPEINVSNCLDRMVAMVRAGTKRSGKEFVETDHEFEPQCEQECAQDSEVFCQRLANLEDSLLEKLEVALPQTELPRWSGIVNPSLYGIRTHGDVFNRRQRLVLLHLIDSLRVEFQTLLKTTDADTARAVVSSLSGLVDQLVDWNCRLSMWIPQNEQVGRAFCGPGVAMLWDYAETDPVQRGPANLWSKLERIAAGVQSIPDFTHNVRVEHAQAQNLPFEDEMFDAIVTDPPYYDNIYYSLLADFFYSWKRLLLRGADPRLFECGVTNNSGELVASRFRSGSSSEAHEWYCSQLSCAFREAERVLRQDGVFSLVYSHSTLAGWDALIRAFRCTGFLVTSVQPLGIERKQRPRAMTSNTVDTCLVFVCRRNREPRQGMEIKDLLESLDRKANSIAKSLSRVGWSKQDIAIAVYAQGVGMIANASGVTGVSSDKDALIACEGIVGRLFPGFKINRRESS